VCVGVSGVLLPGQVQSFPFVFKSTNAGIFTEVWALQTCPLLAGGQTIRVTLRGVAFREDINKHKREDLEVRTSDKNVEKFFRGKHLVDSRLEWCAQK
jgi:hypothetical protein